MRVLRRNFAFELHLQSREDWRTDRIYRCELTARVRDAQDNAEIALNRWTVKEDLFMGQHCMLSFWAARAVHDAVVLLGIRAL